MKYETARIYGKVNVIRKDENSAYLEVAYTEYRNDGSIKCTGTEDFSSKRWSSTAIKSIYTWNGEKRNKGGYRWFDFQGNVRFSGSPKIVKMIYKTKYNAELIELR